MAGILQYQYRPIGDSDGIRLLELKPSSDFEATIDCSLVHTTLHECDEDLIDHYTALSYVWGDAKITTRITVEGLGLDITINLASALRYMRDATRKRLIWADAICINQSDNEEKNRQVRQMGQVYQTAAHTIIFLGDPTEDTDIVLGTARGSLASTQSKARDALPWTDLLVRSWFQRVWVYQELIFSLDPWVQCGKARVRWDTLYQTVKTLKQANRHTQPCREILLMEEGRRRFVNHTSSSMNDAFVDNLVRVLDSRRGLGVLDPRDMLFAHRGMLGNPPGDGEENRLVDVDYTKDCIGRAEIYQSFYPTWIPDWTQQAALYQYRRLRDAAEYFVARVELNMLQQGYYYRVKMKRDFETAEPWYLTSNPLLIAVSGSQVGTICQVSDLVTGQEVSLQLEFGSMIKGTYNHGTRKAIESVIFHHWRGILDLIMANRNTEDSIFWGGQRLKFKDELRSCITQTDVDFVEGEDQPINKVPPLGIFERLIRHLVLHAMTDNSNDYPHFLRRRRFATMQNGRLVLVPGRAVVGDTSCFFDGDYTTPFLLRPHIPTGAIMDTEEDLKTIHSIKPSAKIGHFQLIGECFIDGLISMQADRVSSILKIKSQHEVLVLH
ncbi:heterokaryon incompatibility protein-domain-containing protein [Rhexocercosporidium sp. MPI-PUGE-AT-0058]|nr:heterokaryon incompatibility protein-domain-containing protein [Rhexocercosporidium sp. MPI-PUGE-AT-0058]